MCVATLEHEGDLNCRWYAAAFAVQVWCRDSPMFSGWPLALTRILSAGSAKSRIPTFLHFVGSYAHTCSLAWEWWSL